VNTYHAGGDMAEVVAAVAAGSLGVLGDVQAVPPLIALLQTPQMALGVQRCAAVALGELGDTRAIPALQPHAHDTQAMHDLPLLCALALAHLGDASARPLLRAALRVHEWKSKRKDIRAALAALDARASKP
jgi:HEAT repeat protein